jgi:hypothetical protein
MTGVDKHYIVQAFDELKPCAPKSRIVWSCRLKPSCFDLLLESDPITEFRCIFSITHTVEPKPLPNKMSDRMRVIK